MTNNSVNLEKLKVPKILFKDSLEVTPKAELIQIYEKMRVKFDIPLIEIVATEEQANDVIRAGDRIPNPAFTEYVTRSLDILSQWLFSEARDSREETIIAALSVLPLSNKRVLGIAGFPKITVPMMVNSPFESKKKMITPEEIVAGIWYYVGYTIRKVMKNETNAENALIKINDVLANKYSLKIKRGLNLNKERFLSSDSIRELFIMFQIYAFSEKLERGDPVYLSFLMIGESAGLQLLAGLRKIALHYRIPILEVLEVLASGDLLIEANGIFPLVTSYCKHADTYINNDNGFKSDFYPIASVKPGLAAKYKILAGYVSAILASDVNAAIKERGMEGMVKYNRVLVFKELLAYIAQRSEVKTNMNNK